MPRHSPHFYEMIHSRFPTEEGHAHLASFDCFETKEMLSMISESSESNVDKSYVFQSLCLKVTEKKQNGSVSINNIGKNKEG